MSSPARFGLIDPGVGTSAGREDPIMRGKNNYLLRGFLEILEAYKIAGMANARTLPSRHTASSQVT
jgi:hypothetical protein